MYTHTSYLVLCASLLSGETVAFRPLADGCARVYVDVGSNIGVQIRKLFEPRLYPRAPIIPLFDKYFGMKRSADDWLCAFGFEPSPVLEPRLSLL